MAIVTPEWFREVMGNYPTGVVVATALVDGAPVGMTLGTFVSVSLDPPLVAILPAKSSTTFPKIREAGSFCVNVLSDRQEHVCRLFATSGADKFAGVQWTSSRETGSPQVLGAVAWVDCEIVDVQEAGDHYWVLGRVRSMEIGEPTLPLLFLQGGYGRFSTPTLTVRPDVVIAQALPLADAARGPLEVLTAKVGMEATATVMTGDVVIPILTTGVPGSRVNPPMLGKQFPFIPPFGLVFAAWAEPEVQDAWMRRVRGPEEQGSIEALKEALERARTRGWWAVLRDTVYSEVETRLAAADGLGIQSPRQLRSFSESLTRMRIELESVADRGLYDVRLLGAPAFDRAGHAKLTLAVHPEQALTGQALQWLAQSLVSTALEVTSRLQAMDID